MRFASLYSVAQPLRLWNYVPGAKTNRPGRSAGSARACAWFAFREGGCTCWPPSASGDACPLQPCCTTSCGDSSDWVFPEKADLGYTIVFPGIWGIQVPDRWIVQGLVQAQTPSAIELYDWTAGPLLLFYNLRALERNQRAAQTIARKIMAYQDRYPGRPVNLVGYSGRSGNRRLWYWRPCRRTERCRPPSCLRSPWRQYDLGTAMVRTERGIHSFYSPLDVPPADADDRPPGNE